MNKIIVYYEIFKHIVFRKVLTKTEKLYKLELKNFKNCTVKWNICKSQQNFKINNSYIFLLKQGYNRKWTKW